MKNILNLSRLMLRNQLAALNPFAASYTNKKKMVRSILGTLGLSVIFLSLIGLVIWLEVEAYKFLTLVGQTMLLPGLALLVSMIATVVLGFFQSMSELYQDRDVTWLAVLPVTSREIFTAKVVCLYANELLVNLLILGPALILYCIGQGTAWPFLASVIAFIGAPMIPVALVVALSSLLMRIAAFARHRQTIIMGLSMVLALAYSFGVTSMNSSNSDPSQLLMTFLRKDGLAKMILSKFPPAEWAARGLTEPVQMLLFFAVSAAAIAALLLLFGGSYLHVAMRQSEHAQGAPAKAGKAGKAEFGVKSPLRTLISLEWREMLRTPAWSFNALAGVVLFPVMICVGTLSGTAELGPNFLHDEMITLQTQVHNGYIFMVLSMIIGMGSMINPACATAYSREGGRYPFALTLPVSNGTRLLAKLIVGLEINLMTTVSIALIAVLVFGIYPLTALLACIAANVIGFAVTAPALARDNHRPILAWLNETAAIKKNANSALGMLYWFIATALLGLTFYWVLASGMAPAVGTLVFVAAILLISVPGVLLLLRAAKKYSYLPE